MTNSQDTYLDSLPSFRKFKETIFFRIISKKLNWQIDRSRKIFPKGEQYDENGDYIEEDDLESYEEERYENIKQDFLSKLRDFYRKSKNARDGVRVVEVKSNTISQWEDFLRNVFLNSTEEDFRNNLSAWVEVMGDLGRIKFFIKGYKIPYEFDPSQNKFDLLTSNEDQNKEALDLDEVKIPDWENDK